MVANLCTERLHMGDCIIQDRSAGETF